MNVAKDDLAFTQADPGHMNICVSDVWHSQVHCINDFVIIVYNC